MIELEHVTKAYGNKVAVEDLSLRIEPGELFAFLGPNGAGKTTTIKMIVGLLFPTSGRVRVNGYDMATQGDEARRLLSYVPDQPYLYEKLTGREFLQFIAEMYGMPREQARRRMDEVIELFDLAKFVDNLTQDYSHGMRQRTVFASALLHEPRVLIVDEPTVGLDPLSVRRLKDLLRRQADGGVTVFLSTHSLDVVEELADRIGIVDRGHLVSCGGLEALRKQAALDGPLEDVFLKLTAEANQENGQKVSRLQQEQPESNPLPGGKTPKLLDPDPVVRAMAEQDILVMGRTAQEYLAEQRAKAPPELRQAIDRLWRRILEEGR
jgi:ABC-2 type transport system ATP-binding protein